MSDDEWAFIAPYLSLISEAAPQREYPLREVLSGLRWIVRAGAAWRLLPNDLPASLVTHGIQLEVVKLPQAKQGFVLLPWRWVVERSLAWAARFRRLARDYERLPETLARSHFLAFVMLMLHRFVR